MSIILPILLVIVLFLIVVYFDFFKPAGINKFIIPSLLFIKIVAGFSVFFLYTYYYNPETADIYKYFNGGQVIYESTEGNLSDYLRIVTGIQGELPHLHEIYTKTGHWTKQYDYGLYNDNRTMIRFHAILCLISQGNIYIHIIIMAFLSFAGCLALYMAFTKINDANKHLLLAASFLIPSCLFWSSGILKEGLMMFSLGFMFYYFIKLFEKISIANILLFIMFALLLFISKIYVLPVIIPALFFLAISRNMRKRFQLASFFGIILIYALFVFTSKYTIGYDIPKTIAGKQNDFINYVQQNEEKGSNIDLVRLESSASSFMKQVPIAILNSFLRPYPGEINSIFLALAFIENTTIILLIILMLTFFKKFNNSRFRFALFSLLFTLVLFSLVGLSTPNIGAIVRYKVPVLPFLLAVILSLTDYDRILRKMKGETSKLTKN